MSGATKTLPVMTDTRGSVASALGGELTLDDAVDVLARRIRLDLRKQGLCNGTRRLFEALRAVDRNGDGLLSRKDLLEGLRISGVFLATQDVGCLIRILAPRVADLSGTSAFVEGGFVPVDELLDVLRGGDAVSERRLAVVDRVANALGLDKDGGGSLSAEEVAGRVNASGHPDFRKGLMSEEAVHAALVGGMLDPESMEVTYASFASYWSDVSVLEPSDENFVDCITSTFSTSEHPPASAVASSVSDFESRLRDAARRRAHGTETDATALIRAFRSFDARGDGDGRITMDEFEQAVDHIACTVDSSVLDAIFLEHGEPPKYNYLRYRPYVRHVFAEEEAKTSKTGFEIGGASRLF